MEYKFDANYKKMYTTLFNAVTDAVEQMNCGNIVMAKYLLQKAQDSCEEIFVKEE